MEVSLGGKPDWHADARREALRLRALYRALIPGIVLVALLFGLLAWWAAPAPDEDGLALLIALVVVMGTMGPFLAFVGLRKAKTQLHGLDTLDRFLAACPTFQTERARIKTGFAFGLALKGRVDVDGHAIETSIELQPSVGDVPTGQAATALASRPAHISVRTPWRRPDILLISSLFFYAELSVLHPLESFALREDIWKRPWEGVYSNWVFKRLEARIVILPEESADETSTRLNQAFEVFREALRHSQSKSGTFSPRLRHREGNISLPLTFGFSRMGYCTSCYRLVDFFRWVDRCSNCGGNTVKVLTRSGLGYENPRKHEERIRRWASGERVD